jgi:hypothetical protein
VALLHLPACTTGRCCGKHGDAAWTHRTPLKPSARRSLTTPGICQPAHLQPLFGPPTRTLLCREFLQGAAVTAVTEAPIPMSYNRLGEQATQQRIASHTRQGFPKYEEALGSRCPLLPSLRLTRAGPQGGAEDFEMDPRRPLGRTPSPGQPLRNYQLEDRYASPGPLEIPMGPNPAAASGDRLPLQPSVCVAPSAVLRRRRLTAPSIR